MSKEWNHIPIKECYEDCVPIPKKLYCLKPHPYVNIGAPYATESAPWQLRKGVIKRLLKANAYLTMNNPHLKLAIFDAWRPIKVQRYMVRHAIKTELLKRGLTEVDLDRDKYREVANYVYGFWAVPSQDRSKPPPHSTGSAIDITLVDLNGNCLDMGGEIDEIGEISHPDFFEYQTAQGIAKADIFNKRRKLLSSVLMHFGFAQHPNEWWHFSYGDQLWAFFTGSNTAIYGSWPLKDNSSVTL